MIVRIIISHVGRGQTFVLEMYLQTGRRDMDEAGKAPTISAVQPMRLVRPKSTTWLEGDGRSAHHDALP